MKTCLNCDHVQEQGMFCAKCGKELVTQGIVQQQQVKSQEPNPQVEKLKQISNGYVGTFMSLLKKPTQPIQTNDNLVNSFISFMLFTFIAAFTMYWMARGLYNEYIGEFYSYSSNESTSLPITMLVTLFIIIALFAIVAVVLLFLIIKIFIGQASFKQLFVQVTNYYPAIIGLVVVSFLLQLVGMLGLALLLIIAALFIAILLIPLYEVIRLIQGTTIKIDYFYVYLILATIIIIVIYIISNTILSTYLEELKSSFLDML